MAEIEKASEVELPDLVQEALKKLSEKELKKMEHCVGFDRRKVYHRKGFAYFKPHRNYFNPGGTDCEIWAGIKKKGYADSGKDDKYYWLNKSGYNILSWYEQVYIYSENARGNELDASDDVLEVLLDDYVFCGYGCWLPSGAKRISVFARLPYKLTLSTLKYLKDKCGYVDHVYEGGCDDEGFPHCTHGWILTKKWLDENKERVERRQEEEYERLDRILREPVTVLEKENA